MTQSSGASIVPTAEVEADPEGVPTAATRHGFRPELQAMRAVAVLVVVAYHVWPNRFPGGYVGVDVFFVLSGFLITGNMLREVARTGRLSLHGFWASRVRRILPASLVAITTTCILGTYLLQPMQLHRTADDAVAATIYTINWVLADQSVAYLAPTNDPTIYQHYWSLAVEEQFYLVWPVLIAVVVLVTGWLTRRRPVAGGAAGDRRPLATRRGLLATFLVLVVTSFVYSLWRVAAGDPTAYFATTARLWELGLGALLALIPVGFSLPRLVRTVLGFTAMGLVGFATFAFNEATPFPGATALIPTGAAALWILAGPVPDAFCLKRLTELRAVQWLGNISYSLYLWHFPVVIIWIATTMARPNLWGGMLVVGIGLVLAAGSYYFVENPIRYSSWLRTRPWTTLLIFAAAMAVTLASTALPRMRESQLLGDGVSTDARVEIGRQGWLYLALGDNLRLPEPDFRLSDSAVDRVVRSQGRISDYYHRLGVDYYVGVPPAKTTVYPEFMRKPGLTVGVTAADVLIEAINGRTAARTVDLKSVLVEAKKEGKVYAQLDTHWTQLGAYKAYEAIVARLVHDGVFDAGTRPVSVDFTLQTASGELAGMLGRDWTEGVPIAQWQAHSTSAVDEAAQGKCASRCVVTVLTNPSAPHRTLFIYGDSFSAVPRQVPRWMAEHFSTVVLITSGQPILPGLEAEMHPDVVIYLATERSAVGVLANAAKALA